MGDIFSLGGLLLGASSAATQVEGGDKNNNWYDWYRRGNIKDGSDPSVATMHWQRWREDTELMAGMGLQCCRLGLEWSRIEPERGVFDEGTVAHYVEELRALNERGIKPMVTLWHFSNPLWFERSGGFLARGAKLAFLEYVEYIVPRLAPYVDCWITLNEPNVYAVNSYMSGDWPPGVRSVPTALRVMAALTPCHIEAYKLIHRLVPDARVSFANHLRVFAPRGPQKPRAHRGGPDLGVPLPDRHDPRHDARPLRPRALLRLYRDKLLHPLHLLRPRRRRAGKLPAQRPRLGDIPRRSRRALRLHVEGIPCAGLHN